VAARRQPPAPEAQPGHGEFPGTRALATLRELVGDGSPHPMGSLANAAVRDRLLASLRSAGYSPVVERGFSCFAVRQKNARRRCAPLPVTPNSDARGRLN